MAVKKLIAEQSVGCCVAAAVCSSARIIPDVDTVAGLAVPVNVLRQLGVGAL